MVSFCFLLAARRAFATISGRNGGVCDFNYSSKNSRCLFAAHTGFGVYRHLLTSTAFRSNAPSPSAAEAAAAAAAAAARLQRSCTPDSYSSKGRSHAVEEKQRPDAKQQDFLCLSSDAAGAGALACYTNGELLRSLLVYTLCMSDLLVKNCEMLISLSSRIFGPRLTFFAIKNTLFKVFCGGENLQDVVQILNKLQRRNQGAILDYAAEQKVVKLGSSEGQGLAGGDKYEETLRITKETIDLAAAKGNRFVATKVTAFGETEPMVRSNSLILAIDRLFAHIAGIEKVEAIGRPCPKRLSAAVVSEQKFVSSLTESGLETSETEALFDELLQQPGGDSSNSKSVSYFQWRHKVTPETAGQEQQLRCLAKVLPVLSASDLSLYKDIKKRFFTVFQHAAENKSPPVLLVDAEQSSLQELVHLLAVEAQKQFNTHEVVIVSNTYQAYLKDTLARLTRDLELARRFHFPLGVKLVRGAYVALEKQIAQETGEPLLVHDSIEDTHASYDACTQLLFHNLQHVDLLLASHNARSLEKAARLLRQGEHQWGLLASRKVTFGQLYGMGDAVSHGLTAAGFSVFKYLPFGPVKETIPYLVRRVKENGGMLAGARMEVRYLLKEIKRRLTGGKQVQETVH